MLRLKRVRFNETRQRRQKRIRERERERNREKEGKKKRDVINMSIEAPVHSEFVRIEFFVTETASNFGSCSGFAVLGLHNLSRKDRVKNKQIRIEYKQKKGREKKERNRGI